MINVTTISGACHNRVLQTNTHLHMPEVRNLHSFQRLQGKALLAPLAPDVPRSRAVSNLCLPVPASLLLCLLLLFFYLF